MAQMFCFWAMRGHVFLHHATQYIFFAAVLDAADGKLKTDLHVILKILYSLITLNFLRTVAKVLFDYLSVHV